MITDDMEPGEQFIRRFALALGWDWPADAKVPPGMYAALEEHFGFNRKTCREVYSGRHTVPVAWLGGEE